MGLEKFIRKKPIPKNKLNIEIQLPTNSIPTMNKLDHLEQLTIHELREFAHRYNLFCPSTPNKQNIIHWIKIEGKHPSNIHIDTDIQMICEKPDSYNENVWNYIVDKSRKNKQWGLDHINQFGKSNCKMTNDMIIEYLEKSVYELAKKHYEYFDMRSHAMGELGYPIDPESNKKWEELTTGQKHISKGLLDF